MTRVFGVDYHFLACGSVFTSGLEHAAESLGVTYAHADWSDASLPAQINKFQPQLLLAVHGRKFSRRWPKPLASPSAVWLLDEPYECDETASWSSRFDHVFVNDASTLHRHKNSSVLPVCYDPAVHVPSAEPKPHQVGFIGGGNSTRQRYLSALAANGMLSYVVGGDWSDRRINAVCRSRNIPASQVPTWYQQTRIVLNVFREVHHYNAQQVPATSLNPRVYEALACGALIATEWRPEVAELVPEMPTFRTVDECVGIITDLLANPERAETIRLACAERLKPHTYAARLRTVLEKCGLIAAAA